MKTKEQILQQAFVGQEADIHLNIASGYKFGHYPDSVQRTYIYASMQFFADQEKQALKEKIKRELLTEWTWSDVALMSDVLKKIERL